MPIAERFGMDPGAVLDNVSHVSPIIVELIDLFGIAIVILILSWKLMIVPLLLQ